ncbi:dipeptidase [Adhaeribacter aerolatus]|uniref:Dipeptidase n=1 Tax=Adhaeribacter aerolatus TaxID=670289 RepID=A0A512B441_9BACT|nr:dipeptidase [Adhaeribacter aerolatus]
MLFLPVRVKGQDYRKWHEEAIVVDLHNDVLIAMMRGMDIADDLSSRTHSDLRRFKAGGVDAQFFSVWCDQKYGPGKAFRYANRQIDSLQAVIARNPDKIMLVQRPEQLYEAVKQKKLAAIIGIEGGHMLEHKLANLDQLYNRGARYLTLTWNNSNTLASSARDENRGSLPSAKKGLTEFGQQVIRRMNGLGMLVDLSHVGEKTFWEAIHTTTKPVIVSHSNVYRLAPHYRNLKDDQIKAIAQNGGVIGLNFNSVFIDPGFNARQNSFLKKHQAEVAALQKSGKSKASILAILARKYPQEATLVRPPLSKLLDHLDYIVKLVGVDYVSLGSDFDGITATPRELNSVADFPLITEELLSRGYTQQDINKILGGNFIRVWKAQSKE